MFVFGCIKCCLSNGYEYDDITVYILEHYTKKNNGREKDEEKEKEWQSLASEMK